MAPQMLIPVQVRGSTPGLESRNKQAGVCVCGVWAGRTNKSRIAAEPFIVLKPSLGEITETPEMLKEKIGNSLTA